MNQETKELFSFIIGQRIKVLRKEMKISQTDLGKALGSQSLISLIESGKQIPVRDVLENLADRLNDPLLHSYVKEFKTETSTFEDILQNHKDSIISALLSYNGKWDKLHGDISIGLCEDYYKEHSFDNVRNLCKKIMNHISDDAILGKSMFYYGSVFLFEFSYNEAKKWLVLAEKHLDSLNDSFKSRLLYNLGYVHEQQHNHSLALWYAKLAAEKSLQCKNYVLYTKSLGLLGITEHRLGNFSESYKSLQDAYRLMSQTGESLDKARIECSISEVLLSLEKYTESEEWSLKAAETGSAVNDSLAVCMALENISIIKCKQGHYIDARQVLENAIQIAKEIADKVSLAQLYLLGSRIPSTQESQLEFAQNSFDIVNQSDNILLKIMAAEQISKLHSDENVRNLFQQESLVLYRKYIKQTSHSTLLSILQD